MGKPADGHARQAQNRVTTDKDGVIVAVLHGLQTKESMAALREAVAKAISDLHAQHKKALILVDIRSLGFYDSTSGAHMESRTLFALPVDGAAIVGNRGIIRLAMYIVRVSKSTIKLRFFSNERKARAWLANLERPKPYRSPVGLVAGIAIGLIGATTLVGWQLRNEYLVGWLSALRPMNPLAAAGLVILGYSFILYWKGNLRWLRYAGVFGVALGVSALLPLHIDYLLYGGRVTAAGAHTQLADSAAIAFICMGIVGLLAGRRPRWVEWVEYAAAGVVAVLALYNVFGQLYAHDYAYSNTSFVMAFNLAVAFAVAAAALVALVLHRQRSTVLSGVNRTGWLIVAALLFVQIATYTLWSQTISRNKADALTDFSNSAHRVQAALDQRLAAYVNALYGFQGLFRSSTDVNQGEFSSYYEATNIAKNYPGLRALSFIARVNDAGLPAFVAKHKADTSLHPKGNPNFAVTGKSSLPEHYIVTYVAGTNTNGGADLSADADRLRAFRKAAASGQAVTSGTVQFAGTNGQPAQEGFFITVPVAYGQNPRNYVGFVNAVFNYQDFFKHTFGDSQLGQALDIRIIDATDQHSLFSLRRADLQPTDPTYTFQAPIQVADRAWQLGIQARTDFGISTNQRGLPLTFLVAGQLFSALLVVIFVLQARARRQGFQLADTITLDLQHERNLAVAQDQRSQAILSSIGDAVFAIDTHRRITLFNPAARQLSGRSEAEALGKRYDTVLHFELEKTGRVNDGFIAKALSGRVTAMNAPTALVHADGRRVPVADSAAPIHDAQGKIVGAIIVFRDVSKEYELDKAKGEFVSLASHQLRTPLSAINWYGEMLLNGEAGKLSKTQHEYVKEIAEGSQRMVELVNSLLNVSRLEVGKLTNRPAPVAMADLIDSLEKELTTTVRDKHLVFGKRVAKLPPVVADPKQLRMILQNLMSNAVKYTPEKGTIEISLRKATAADRAAAGLQKAGQYWYFSVKDSGFGIPKNQQSKIFGKLFRADNVQTLDVEGTGLGLYIVKQVVEKMGGRVWFESVESVGTTFYVVAPFGK